MIKTTLKNRSSYVLVLQRLTLLCFFFLISLTFFRCANMQRPTGGPKDSLPPKLLSESPENFTRNFNAKEIVLSFDEYIKLNNQIKELSISPDVDKQPEFKVKKKTLHIILPDSLEKNTTYTINFGKGLVDYNEGNPIINYNYVFSTGNELDSLTVSGSVKDAFKKEFDVKTDKDIRVLLIPTSQDSIFGKKKANIFTTVDSLGNFQFKNLKANTYRIYAIKEQNNDRIYNSPEESIGFNNDSIVLNNNISGIKLEYSKGRPTKFRTVDKKIEKNESITLIFNQPIDTPELEIISPNTIDKNKFVHYSLSNDTANIFVSKLETDSIKIQVSDNKVVKDTIVLRRNKNDKYERFIVPTLNISNKVDKINHIKITSKYPIQSIDKQKIILNEDSISRRNFQLQQDSLDKQLYYVRYNWKPNKNYELIIQEKAILSPFNDFNKEFKNSFTLDETENYGDIIFKFNGLDSISSYLVQLIDVNKEKVFSTRKILNKNELVYNKFPGGKYKLRIIKDLNHNGRWDAADVYKHTQAEPIWYLDKEFTIRSNWEQTETLNVSF